MAQVQAQESFIREGVLVSKGDILDDTHEIVRNTPKEWWTPLQSRFAPVEEATAKAGTKRPTKAKAEE